MYNNSAAKVTGQSKSVKINGKPYSLAPMNLNDIGILSQWLKDLPFMQLRDHLDEFGDLYDSEKKNQLTEEAIELSKKLSRQNPTDEEKELRGEYLDTLEATKMFLWLSLKKNHPEFKTPNSVGDLITVINKDDVQDDLDMVNSMEDEEDKEEPGNVPAEQSKP